MDTPSPPVQPPMLPNLDTLNSVPGFVHSHCTYSMGASRGPRGFWPGLVSSVPAVAQSHPPGGRLAQPCVSIPGCGVSMSIHVPTDVAQVSLSLPVSLQAPCFLLHLPLRK